MRYFIAQNGTTVVAKNMLEGLDADINALVQSFKTAHPNLTVTEIDQPTFDATTVPPVQVPAQIAWANFKAQSPQPTALQAIIFLAKYLGLE